MLTLGCMAFQIFGSGLRVECTSCTSRVECLEFRLRALATIDGLRIE